ncbi:MAG: hypothetical protein ACREUT_06715 [Steroidobacteraceae bacterium]
MSASIDDLIIPMLRAIQAEQAPSRERDREIVARLTGLETAVATLRREVADLYGEVVTQHARYDRVNDRLERIERRLEIAAT